MTQYSCDGENTRIQCSHQENIEFLKIFLVLANLIGRSVRGIGIVDSEYLNFFKSQQAATTDFISLYFLLHQKETPPKRKYLRQLQSLTRRYPKEFQVSTEGFFCHYVHAILLPSALWSSVCSLSFLEALADGKGCTTTPKKSFQLHVPQIASNPITQMQYQEEAERALLFVPQSTDWFEV